MVYVGQRTPALDAQFRAEAKASAKEAVPPQIKLGDRCTVLDGRPDRIGALVEVIESPAGFEDDNVSYVRDFSGEEFFIAHCDLRPPTDIEAAIDRHVKAVNFDPYQGAVEYYNSLSDEEKALLKLQGIC